MKNTPQELLNQLIAGLGSTLISQHQMLSKNPYRDLFIGEIKEYLDEPECLNPRMAIMLVTMLKHLQGQSKIPKEFSPIFHLFHQRLPSLLHENKPSEKWYVELCKIQKDHGHLLPLKFKEDILHILSNNLWNEGVKRYFDMMSSVNKKERETYLDKIYETFIQKGHIAPSISGTSIIQLIKSYWNSNFELKNELSGLPKWNVLYEKAALEAVLYNPQEFTKIDRWSDMFIGLNHTNVNRWLKTLLNPPMHYHFKYNMGGSTAIPRLKSLLVVLEHITHNNDEYKL
ncbi:MAG TPA: hypothetical protein VIY47_13690, partial [Ignavibacteriaceae bacterium]